MTKETVSAQTKEGAAVNFDYDFGENIDEANNLFGADVVWAYAKRALVIAAQGHARGLVKSGKSAEDITEAMTQWKPGAPRVGKSPEDRMREQWNKMSPEDRANLLRELQGEASPAPAAARKRA